MHSDNEVFGSQNMLAALEHVHDAVVLLDSSQTVIFFNRAAEKLWGYPGVTVFGRRAAEIPLFYTPEQTTESQQTTQLTVITATGEENALSATISYDGGPGNEAPCMIVVHVDQEKITQLSNFDHLTGLPKRRALHQYIDTLIAGDEHTRAALFFLDLDHFKDVNDALGYAAGDQVLAEIARRLSSEFSRHAFVSHADSDSFVMVMPDCDITRATSVAQKIQALFRIPFNVADMALNVTVSTGVSLYPEHGAERDMLLKQANHASHQAKAAASGGYLFFHSEMNQVDQERLKLAAALKLAIAGNHLHLHYQPQVWLKNGELYGVEALARWTDPVLGDIPPGKFIALAEETGEIEAIGRWTLHEACRQMAEWRNNKIMVPVVSVNLSPINFYNSSLPQYIGYLLRQFRIPPDCLTIEITEGVMMDKRPETMEVICAVRELGVGLSMDDFGTGFSCLSRLAHLPMTELKIDQSFMRDLNDGSKMKAIATTVVKIGQSLQQTVVAEGVETEQQRSQLCELQCDIAQGYLYSRPLNASALAVWLMSSQPRIEVVV
ncbi:putative bifunctional diguanylate cyclase/phosphodiesterase [Mangrovibacter plantisponsor]|uniref:PAS domain S-box-containing protein/diguanylate cyclase (GGDEF)-like protein n=1 Tax=Mangrovibacter plantisponsor TaxID=451513 RepID=A0A317PVQ0_9ENTR|nr:EAL domain-containing protein [Mangrovibacter plantisponsor]PWW06749.1 PAS domain S-box-containing protein/diguanylate cyclase (GGDEF)-like protein [Mangrovibacter plantisponsor]